jgi:hypothetical protein
MSVMLLPRTAEPEATTKPHDPAPLLQELAILRLESATPSAENAAVRKPLDLWKGALINERENKLL